MMTYLDSQNATGRPTTQTCCFAIDPATLVCSEACPHADWIENFGWLVSGGGGGGRGVSDLKVEFKKEKEKKRRSF